MDSNTKSVLAIITARGGSKRIKRKNIRDFHGKPIIAYSIQAALDCKLFDRIVVSTEDDEIAEISKEYGAEVPFVRDVRLADDYVGTVEIVADAINRLDSSGDTYKHICCIYPTAPLLTTRHLQEAYQMLCSGNIDYVLPVGEYDREIYHSLRESNTQGIEPIFPEYIGSRTQDLPTVYHDAGQFYWGRREAFLREKTIFGKNSRMLVIPSAYVCDIDYEEDWEKAEKMYDKLKEADTNDK